MGEKVEMAKKPPRQTVLLVDDEASVQLYVTNIFQREGFRVLTAYGTENSGHRASRRWGRPVTLSNHTAPRRQ